MLKQLSAHLYGLQGSIDEVPLQGVELGGVASHQPAQGESNLIHHDGVPGQHCLGGERNIKNTIT